MYNNIQQKLDEEVVDLEEYAARKEPPPKHRHYRVRINKEKYVFDIANPTREQILEKAGLIPVTNWSLRLKIHGSHRLIREGEHVDLTEPGVEKFKALSRDQTEG